FTVSLDLPSSTPVTVHYTTVDGTGIAGKDYVAKSGDATFAPGQTKLNIPVKVLTDLNSQETRTFFLELSGAQNGAIAKGQGQATITQIAKRSVPFGGGVKANYTDNSGNH